MNVILVNQQYTQYTTKSRRITVKQHKTWGIHKYTQYPSKNGGCKKTSGVCRQYLQVWVCVLCIRVSVYPPTNHNLNYYLWTFNAPHQGFHTKAWRINSRIRVPPDTKGDQPDSVCVCAYSRSHHYCCGYPNPDAHFWTYSCSCSYSQSHFRSYSYPWLFFPLSLLAWLSLLSHSCLVNLCSILSLFSYPILSTFVFLLLPLFLFFLLIAVSILILLSILIVLVTSAHSSQHFCSYSYSYSYSHFYSYYHINCCPDCCHHSRTSLRCDSCPYAHSCSCSYSSSCPSVYPDCYPFPRYLQEPHTLSDR